MKFLSSSAAETKKFAFDFARNNSFRVIALSGELGAGKTTFTQGFAKGLGIRKRIISPTFVFVRRYSLQQRTNFFHVDAYRVRSKNDLKGLGLREIFTDPGNLVLIEWAENVREILPKGMMWVRMKHGTKENERVILISNY
ncbi:MAG: tRNA (adenosine(37)-N6)-threonylcarbamoyltransferase complex ATPase subunit type 1 TsaE [Patescibacteria group bacterium]